VKITALALIAAASVLGACAKQPEPPQLIVEAPPVTVAPTYTGKYK
jgi:hypothetical protein